MPAVSTPPDPATVVRLRATTAWGDSALATRFFALGEGLRFDDLRLLVPRPDGPASGDGPLRGDRLGWELLGAGATSGRARVTEVEHPLEDLDGQRLARPGDRAVLRFGELSLRLEVVELPARPPRPALDRTFVAAVLFGLVVVVGGLGLVRTVTGRGPSEPPVALVAPPSIARLLRGIAAGVPQRDPVSPAALPPRAGGGPSLVEAAPRSSLRDPGGAVRRALTAARDRPSPAVPRDVLRTLLTHRAEAERCLVAEPGGAVTVRWVVAPSGRAESAVVTGATPELGDVERCLTHYLAGLAFEPRTHPVTVTHTFQAEPR